MVFNIGKTLDKEFNNWKDKTMEKTKHTQGPWTVKQWDNFPDQAVISDETNTRCLALIDKADEQDEANAALIAAAPDLLEALEKALADAEGAIRVDGMMLGWMDAARAALAKARGADFAPRSDDVGQNDA